MGLKVGKGKGREGKEREGKKRHPISNKLSSPMLGLLVYLAKLISQYLGNDVIACCFTSKQHPYVAGNGPP